MGIFNSGERYIKPGPGVGKNEIKKNRFFLFFEILFRKFTSICTLNAITIGFMIPFIAACVGIFYLLRASSFSMTHNFYFSIIMILSPFMLSGPFFGASVRVAREFSREQPIFLWSEYKGSVKSDWKRNLILSVMGYVEFAMIFVALPFYYYSDFGVLSYVLFAICSVISLIVIIMQSYLYIMSVSFDLSIIQLYKNAFLLSTVCVGRNLLNILIHLAVLALSVLFIWLGLVISEYFFIVFIVLLLGFIIGFLLFSSCYLTFPALQKYIIDPYYAEHPQETSVGLSEQEGSGDGVVADGERELPEYVYHNGRMVHRSVLEKEVIFEDNVNSDNDQ